MKDVMKFIFRDRIHDEVALQTDAALGSHEWLAKYPAALSKVYKELDDDEMAQCKQTLEEWEVNGPGEVQQQQ